MFRKRKELQRLIDTSRKSLAEAEGKLEKLSDELKIARHNNGILLNKNRKQNKTINEIYNLASGNTYGNDKAILNKIIELARPDNQN